MSILIKGMEMPKSCWVCYFQDCGNCLLNAHKVVDKCIIEDRLDEDCPLVPVPPHGRLIEDEAVREQIDEWLDSVGDVVVGHGLSYYGELLGCIEDAPTIIPEEEGET